MHYDHVTSTKSVCEVDWQPDGDFFNQSAARAFTCNPLTSFFNLHSKSSIWSTTLTPSKLKPQHIRIHLLSTNWTKGLTVLAPPVLAPPPPPPYQPRPPLMGCNMSKKEDRIWPHFHSWKFNVGRSIFDELQRVWESGQTQSYESKALDKNTLTYRLHCR